MAELYSVAHYPEATDQALARIPEADAGRDLHPEELVAFVSKEAKRLRTAALEVYDYVWPDSDQPATMDTLAGKLFGTHNLMDVAREFAAHGGAEMVLALLKSWYPDVDLWSLSRGFHQGPTTNNSAPRFPISALVV